MAEYTYEELKRAAQKPEDLRLFNVIQLDEFLAERIDPPKPMLGTWLPVRGLAMVYARTGVGKSIFCLSLALSVASGRKCFGWECPAAKRVLYIDGELPQDHLQTTLRRLCAGLELDKDDIPMWILTIDKQPNGAPKIDHMSDQAAIEAFIEAHEIELIIVDNLSTLTSSEFGENESQSWEEMQSWALRQRSRGRTVLFVHHAGKGGAQRGTSKREDVLDSTVKLQRLDTGEEGFSIEFDKHRRGKKPDVLEVTFKQDSDSLLPIYVRQTDPRVQVVEMYNNGMPPSDIVNEVDVSRPTVYRILKEANDAGELERPYKQKGGV